MVIHCMLIWIVYQNSPNCQELPAPSLLLPYFQTVTKQEVFLQNSKSSGVFPQKVPKTTNRFTHHGFHNWRNPNLFRKLFTLSTAFSTPEKSFIHKPFVARASFFHTAAEMVECRRGAFIHVDIILFPLVPDGQNFFSLSITPLPSLEKQHPDMGCCFFTNVTNQNVASLSSMVA